MSNPEPWRPGRTVTTGMAPVLAPAAGRVRVMSDRCATCDFRPGNRGNLTPGNWQRDCLADEGHIVCHGTGPDRTQPAAVCAGIAAHPDAGRFLALSIAAVGHLQWQGPALGSELA